MIHLRTDEPWFYSDLGDVLRLFYGDVEVRLAGEEETDDGPLFVHRFIERDGLWTDI